MDDKRAISNLSRFRIILRPDIDLKRLKIVESLVPSGIKLIHRIYNIKCLQRK